MITIMALIYSITYNSLNIDALSLNCYCGNPSMFGLLFLCQQVKITLM